MRNRDASSLLSSWVVGHSEVIRLLLPLDVRRRQRYGVSRFGRYPPHVWQNLILPDIPADKLEATRQAIVDAGLSDSAATVSAGTVACTGNTGCRFSATDTKAHALALAGFLDERFKIVQPIIFTSPDVLIHARNITSETLDCWAQKLAAKKAIRCSSAAAQMSARDLAESLFPQFALQICRRSWRGSSGRSSDAHGGRVFPRIHAKHRIEQLKQLLTVEEQA